MDSFKNHHSKKTDLNCGESKNGKATENKNADLDSLNQGGKFEVANSKSKLPTKNLRFYRPVIRAGLYRVKD